MPFTSDQSRSCILVHVLYTIIASWILHDMLRSSSLPSPFPSFPPSTLLPLPSLPPSPPLLAPFPSPPCPLPLLPSPSPLLLPSPPLHAHSENCQLYHFLHDFVEKTFLDLVRDKCADKLNSCAKRESVGSREIVNSCQLLFCRYPTCQCEPVSYCFVGISLVTSSESRFKGHVC